MKTTIAGIVALGLQIASIWAPGFMASPKVVQSAGLVSFAAGLFAAADGKKKTETDQAEPPAVAKSRAAGA